MARSVSTPYNAIETVYITFEPSDPEDSQWEFRDLLQSIREIVRDGASWKKLKGFPSFSTCDHWIDREDHAILENQHARVTVSEYCGLVAICLVPIVKYSNSNSLALPWCEKIADRFRKLLESAYSGCALRSQGRASNGEQFFTRIDQPGSLVTSKEGQLW